MANHKHQCERCGCVWQHPNSLHEDDGLFDCAHRCPQCGEQTVRKYAGKLAPQFIDPLTEEGRDARSLAASRKEKSDA